MSDNYNGYANILKGMNGVKLFFKHSWLTRASWAAAESCWNVHALRTDGLFAHGTGNSTALILMPPSKNMGGEHPSVIRWWPSAGVNYRKTSLVNELGGFVSSQTTQSRMRPSRKKTNSFFGVRSCDLWNFISGNIFGEVAVFFRPPRVLTMI